MNTFRAKLLPCAGTAGGASPQARAAGQSIIVCGDLSGREARRGTYASRPVRRDEPHPDFQSAGHGFCRAIFAPIAFARARGRLGDGLATRGCGALNSGQPVPISFLGSARVQAGKQSSRCIANRFHVQNSLSDAPSSCLQHDRSDLECPTKALKRLTR